jgi:hypothetical protein
MMITIILLCLTCLFFHNKKNPCLYIIFIFGWLPLFFQDKNVVFYHNPIFLMWVFFPISYLIFEKIIKDKL